MGYTHYWRRTPILNPDQFRIAVDECREVCRASGIPLGDAMGMGKPVFDKTAIEFNGHTLSGEMMPEAARVAGLCWPDRRGGGGADGSVVTGSWIGGPLVTKRALPPNGDGTYESFIVDQAECGAFADRAGARGLVFGFCKTNYRPYDLCVQACLIVLSRRVSRFYVTSDGCSGDWDDARRLCVAKLGYGEGFELQYLDNA